MGMLANVYGEINQQHRRSARTREHVDRRAIAKYRGAFDRLTSVAATPCHAHCTGCGALGVPASVGAREDSSTQMRGPCPHCGVNAWVDLTEDDAVRNLAQIEAYDLDTLDPGRRIREWTLRIGGAVFMGGLCLAAAANSYSAIFSGLTLLVGMVAVLYFSLGLGRARTVRRRALPYRWSLPLSPKATVLARGERIDGSVSAGDDEPLRAPISGRPCVAYRVEVRWESAPRFTRPALVTQRSVALSVGERIIATESMRLDLPVQPVSVDPSRYEAVVEYLRSHGIVETDGTLEFSEAILEPGTAVTVRSAQPHGVIMTAAKPGRRALPARSMPALPSA